MNRLGMITRTHRIVGSGPARFAFAVLVATTAVVPAGQIGVPSALGIGTGPITFPEGNAGVLMGVADLKGNGPLDLVMGHDRFLPFLMRNAAGIPEYGEPVDLQPLRLGDSLVDDSALFVQVPLREADGWQARIAVAAGRVQTFETNDHISLDVIYNDGTTVTLGSFRGNAQLAAGRLAYDSDNDGIGDGTPLDVAFRGYSFPIPPGEFPIRLRVRIDVDGNEEVGVDGIELRAVSGNTSYTVARCGFEDAEGEWDFTTNLDSASVTSNSAEFRGAIMAGDGFNDFVAVVPNNVSFYSEENINLGFNNWERDGFLMVEDTGRDGIPTEVTLEFAPVESSAIPVSISSRGIAFDSSYLDKGSPADGGGLELDPAGDSTGLTIRTSSAITNPAQSWMAWVKVDAFETGSFSTTHPHGIINGYSGTSMATVMRISSGQLQAGWYDGTRYILSTTADTLPLDEWLHVCATNDGTGAPRLFVNGTEWTSTASAGDPSQRPLAVDELRIGFQGLTGNRRILDGAIRDVRIYDRELTPAEVTEVASAGSLAAQPFSKEELKPGSLVTLPDGRILAFSFAGNHIVVSEYAEAVGGFVMIGDFSVSETLPISALAAQAAGSDTIELYITSRGNADYLPYGKPLYDEDFIPYDGAGIWLGGTPVDHISHATVSLSGGTVTLGDISEIDEGLKTLDFGSAGLTVSSPASSGGLIAGGVSGVQYFYPNPTAGSNLGAREHVWLDDGRVALHLGPNARPVSIPSATASVDDLIVQSDVGIHFYKSTGTTATQGGPVYESPVTLTQQQAVLGFGREAVITGGDLDGDGLAELVAGNAAGQLLISRQTGPLQFAAPEPLNVNGRAFRYEAGYRGSLQGPAQARLGYTAPTLFDWNEDGALDILLSNISGDYFVLVRRTESPGIEFDKPRPIYLDGLEFHSTWRNQPAVGDWNGETVPTIVTFDPYDKLRIYRQYDERNILPGELLLTDGGQEISGNAFASSGTGRIRLQLVDWDKDGTVDILAGTTPESSIPNPTTGLPLNGAAKASVLFLRNVGTNTAPEFEEPVVLTANENLMEYDSASVSPLAIDARGSGLELLATPGSGIVNFLSNRTGQSGFVDYFLIY